MTAPTSTDVRARLVETLRRDLIGPGPQDSDLARERLKEKPSGWYVNGYLAPVPEPSGTSAESEEQDDLFEEGDPLVGDDHGADSDVGPARAADDAPEDVAPAVRVRAPSSLGLTVLLDSSVREVEVHLSWGDYVTVPPLNDEELLDEKAGAPDVVWDRISGAATRRVPVPLDGNRATIAVPNSGGAQRPSGALALELHARPYEVTEPEGTKRSLRVLTIMVVNRRSSVRRRYQDVTYAFQVRLAVRCDIGLHPRANMRGFGSKDIDEAIADLHYRDVCEYAVGVNTSADWKTDPDGVVREAATDYLPTAEVERVEPNEDIANVVFGMEALADLAQTGPDELRRALAGLPAAYDGWIAAQSGEVAKIAGAPRQTTAQRLVDAARAASRRITDGIALLANDPFARLAFRAMNEAVARANRQRSAGYGGDPASQTVPKWRPFQLAFILLNLAGLHDPLHPDRETVDLLFFPTGGGKTEAYLGLAAWTIAHRRITNGGKLGAGVAVLMRYTLRLLTLDQLTRAAGVICALELMRSEPAWREGERNVLGDWPIEIGLWVGAAATPNRLGGRGNTGPDTAVGRIRRFKRDGREAPAPIKACPWCGEPFTRDSFRCTPSDVAPQNMEIGCANSRCPFGTGKPLPVLTVDEAIYRRLPAFLIATVDKFAGLPFLDKVGAFFDHVDREDDQGFYGAAEPGVGRKLFGGARLLPPALIIQDELHLISGPLGTVAALYEVALDRLASRRRNDHTIRPKIVASTATVRRADAQIRALFDRSRTAIFPPPGPDRRDSFFAITVAAAKSPGRLYVGLAAPGKGPKLLFLRALTTLLAAGAKDMLLGDVADPYLTALCYFNALRELGGARRIVEDEVRAKLADYGTRRRRLNPQDQPFENRMLRDVLEITSRESTDKVAAAKDALARSSFAPNGVDVALATNMISVGLDISRLGLMVVQGQPKAAAEYIQATSRVGRLADKPGLVLVLLNVHKARDRLHYEGFRQFHASFYRTVEATSVTPWAARAIDRALAPAVVALARHIEPLLTAERAASKVGDYSYLKQAIADEVVRRAQSMNAVGGLAALRQQVEQLIDIWTALAADAAENGGRLYYGYPVGEALVRDPLSPLLKASGPDYERFKASRSMRDVEHVSSVEILDPFGNALT
jgi:Helicase conserved C-terminal domain